MDKLLEHKRYLGITSVVANLENKLHIAISNNPNKDFKEQEFILGVLKDLKINWLEVVEENRIIDKKYLKMANKVDYLLRQVHDLSQENKNITRENSELKKNIM